ncbi:MAG TPA: leucine--tRNA ligase, partial [Saprospirales bacterium]|nr:leucine--tRNA ligase [Saprospirales bacterium]
LQLFDHYFDTLAGTSMPITGLVDQFEKKGNNNATSYSSQEETFTAKEWSAYSAKQKDDVLMNYRLAYRKTGYVNWCEALGTVLANDEIQNGVSERGGHPIEKRAMMQWSFRTTAFAERLLKDLDDVDWSDALKAMQANWIGKSQGAQMFFPLVDSNQSIEIFTTRPDTIFGATYIVLAPEHDLVAQITTDAQKEAVAAYLEYTNSRSERERISEVKEVTGAFTGAYATNPISSEKLPVWIGEYVLKDYGTGAIMAVPSDDERDFNFAKKYDLTITQVVDQSEYPNSGKGDKVGKMINSDFLNGLSVKNAIKEAITKMV